MSGVVPRAVVVTRATAFEALLERHATRGQAEFFLKGRGGSIEAVESAHHRHYEALNVVRQAVPDTWRRAHVDRRDLDRFLFEPHDILIAVGQDGLVANMAKYLAGRPVVGVNPLPDLFDGVLVPHAPTAVAELLPAVAAGRATVEARSMVQAELDDGQRLQALNEIFIGHCTHQSARYRLRHGDREERHSSSGLIVASGTGATGWARSICRARQDSPPPPHPTDRRLTFLVREAFPSRATGVDLTAGVVQDGDRLQITSEMDDGGVIFGDGIESDRLEFSWGQTVAVGIADVALALVSGTV